MTIYRSTSIPSYYEYLTTKALVPLLHEPDPRLTSLVVSSFEWVEVPYFQRGISWKIDSVEDFLSSNSILLGTVILSRFSVENRFPLIPNTQRKQKSYVVLVDGLQRLAIGTMILNSLHELVIKEDSKRKDLTNLFGPLASRVRDFAPIYMYNHKSFSTHPRRAVSAQYIHLAEIVDKWITKNLSDDVDAQKLALMISQTFLQKQIAIDVYSDFTDNVELMYTFLGLNTVRVDLGLVDLLRAYLVEKAASSSWNASDIELMENEFTEIFTDNKEKINAELRPLVGVLVDAIQSGETNLIFPSWTPETPLDKNEVDNFLDFVRGFLLLRGNGYYDEIRQCGSIPFATIILYYYRKYLDNNLEKPSFLSSNGTRENEELHKFLIANYRALLFGGIGRTREYTKSVLKKQITSLDIASDRISVQFSSKGIEMPLDENVIAVLLNRVDREDAKRVFNAMLLPDKSLGWGKSFAPFVFGQRQEQYYIDTILKESRGAMGNGGTESKTIRNLAPIPVSIRGKTSKVNLCSQKLSNNGIYASNFNDIVPHPYTVWLVKEHAAQFSDEQLDDVMYLEANRNPSLGDDRIRFLAQDILTKI